MSAAITVRGVPVEVRDELAARAARDGKTLEEHVRQVLIRSVARPSAEDVRARARQRVRVTGSRADASAILQARDTDRR